ncbi:MULTISPECIES: DUF427 domain-containing protein [unclassified Bradyrhizobium]|uniref:DUF427 domain-containing protein n=1 Tax=unclassified Bradyrhizobium TaxID=2631580 RepID=UPI00339561B5
MQSGRQVRYESGFAPRWYVPRADIDESALTPVKLQTFCPYKALCSYYSIGDARQAAWSYPDAYPEVRRISNFVSFEPDIVSVHLDGTQLRLEPGQLVVPRGPDRNLDIAEVIPEPTLLTVVSRQRAFKLAGDFSLKQKGDQGGWSLIQTRGVRRRAASILRHAPGTGRSPTSRRSVSSRAL